MVLASEPVGGRSRATSCLVIIMSFFILSGAEGFTTEEDQEMISRIEKQVKRRFVIGSQVSEHAIIQDFSKQVCCSTNQISRRILSLHATSLC